MGWELVLEALNQAPDDLSWRERFALIVLASAADDSSRECPPGIEDRPEITRQLNLSRTQRFLVISALVDKGALARVKRGHNGVKAAYSITAREPVKGPVNRDATQAAGTGETAGQSVDNPVKGPVNRDATDPLGPGFRDATDPAKDPGFRDATDPLGPGFRDATPADPVPTSSVKDKDDDLISRTHARTREAIRTAVPGVTDDEIDETIRIIKVRYNPRNTEKYIERMIASGDLEPHIPCGLGDTKHSDACRSRNCPECKWSWCEGRCHRNRQPSAQPGGMSA